MMRAGELRDRVTIQTNTTAADGKGVYVNAWATLATVWAKVEAASGSQEGQDIASGTVTYTVTIRYLSTVSRENRIQWGSRYLEILSALPDPHKTELVIQCVEAA